MTRESFAKLFPGSKVQDLFAYWEETVDYAKLNTPERVAMFLAQVGHECAGFTKFQENLNYSAQRLAETWPGRYARIPKAIKKIPNDFALRIARQPELIANFTYAQRNGNGDANSGDGWKYRGRGAIMTTGKNNYKRVDVAFKMNGQIVANPDLLITPRWALMSAALFWVENNLNVFSDKKQVKACRKAVNGGFIGLAEVTDLYNKILHA